MPLLSGVYLAKKKNGETYYRSSITFQNKHISLGSFSNEFLAHKAYQLAGKVLNTSRYTLETYLPNNHILSFEKWVVLINFRDNRLYFKTPIYIRNRYFEYYLDPQTLLKFAVDDLFYYANHKIMRRGGHLFVADFGMQVNILSRYGIKNFAVPGRDFMFMNGDTYDYRYENIRIINNYHGTLKTVNKGIPVYLSKIHINGDYIIGRYPTEDDAAIAYNKAAEFLMKHGVSKHYPLNFINGLSTEEYKKRYDAINLSKKIIHYESN
ncbi:MAG: hypothetical protein ACERKN_03575 [Velocimicrobium sp.]